MIVFVDSRRGLCFTSIREGQCLNPSSTLVTKSTCCCTVDTMEQVGIGWGQPCEPCPTMDTREYKQLCPHGPHVDNGGNGKFDNETYLLSITT